MRNNGKGTPFSINTGVTNNQVLWKQQYTSTPPAPVRKRPYERLPQFKAHCSAACCRLEKQRRGRAK